MKPCIALSFKKLLVKTAFSKAMFNALVLISHIIAVSAWAAADAGLTENQIKAAYLYKFATYVEWPPSTFADAHAPLTIGVVGADEIAAELANITSGLSLSDRVVQVKSLKSTASFADVQILFIGPKEVSQIKHLMSSVELLPILTVTASPSALDAGSVINFVPVDNHIRFEVSVAQAERCGLKISARLLAVAQKVDAGGL